jgi:hypothetical protein
VTVTRHPVGLFATVIVTTGQPIITFLTPFLSACSKATGG